MALTSGHLMWTIAKWSERTTATYHEFNEAINGKHTDNYGRMLDDYSTTDNSPRKLINWEETANAIYMSYDQSNKDAVIFRYN